MKKILLYYSFLFLILLFSGLTEAQTPVINNLELNASTTSNLTTDDLICTYTTGGPVVETTSAWWVNSTPLTVLYLPFESGFSNALLDFSGWNHHTVTTGNATEVPTWDGTGGYNGNGAFIFDGDDYLLAGDILPLNGDYTKTAWISVTGDDYRNIMSSTFNGDRDHHFKIDPDGTLNAGHSFGWATVRDPEVLIQDQWYFVAVTFDFESGEMVLYKDGVEVDWGIVPEDFRSITDASVEVGARSGRWGWQGSMDELRIYNRVLSSEQIQALYVDGNNFLVPEETAGTEDWRVRVTPFSSSEVGSTYASNTITILGPTITGLSLSASSPDNLTIDQLTSTYNTGVTVVETASAWYKNGTPESLLYLPFEGGYFNALRDLSGNNNHASNAITRSQQPGLSVAGGYNGTGGYVFNGNDYIDAGDILPLNSPYTKTVWVNSTGGTEYRNIMSSAIHDVNNHFLKIDPDGTLNAGHSFGTPIVNDPVALNSDQWYFVALTFDYASGEMILYRDGAEVDRSIVPEALRSVVDDTVLIGSMAYQADYGWMGRIDEPRLYGHVLSAEQISAMYTAGNDVIVPEETSSLDEWYVAVTPISLTDIGATYTSNIITIHSVVVTDIADQTIQEGSTFSTIDLDDYVVDYDYTDSELDWSTSGSTDLIVSIDPTTHIATINIPDINWYGSEDITFTATNPVSDNDATEVTFIVNGENDAPVLTLLGGQITDEDVSLIGLAVDFTDPDPTDSHTITVLSSNPNVTVANLSGDITGSTYDLVPAANWNGSTQITVTVTDNGSGALTDSEVYSLIVNEVNDAPVLAEIGDQVTGEDTVLVGLSVVFTDLDVEDQHTISIVSDDAGVTAENLTGHISGSLYDLVPATDWNGTAQITVSVTDNGTGALVDIEVYTLTVNPVNDAPILSDVGDQITNEDNNLTGLLVVYSDPDISDDHTLTIVSSDPNVSMTNLSGHVSGSTYDLELVADWFGTAQITVRVTENGTGALSDFETYTLTVNAINDAPRIAEVGDQYVDEDDVLRRIPIDFSDEATDSHIVEIVSSEPNVVLANFGGHTSGSTYSLVPAKDWYGAAQITVTVTEVGGGLSDTEIYTLNVNNINDAPDTVRLSNTMVDERVALETVVGLFSSYDVDMTDTHTYTFVLDGGVNDVDNDAFIIVGDTLKTNVNLDFEGKSSYSILVQSDDGQGGTSSQNFTITVNDVNETGVEDIYNNPSFNVYPVPAIDNINVEVDNPDNKELLLEIYSNTGRLVHAEPIYSKSRIDLTGFTDGIYILRVKGEQVYGTRKIIVKDR